MTGNTSISPSSIDLETALSNVPNKFKLKIITSYLELKKRYSGASRDSSWDAAGLSAGKFCEGVLRFLQNELTGTFIPFGTHISNFADECGKLIKLPTTSGNESTRIIIPRALIYLYTLRGKRGIGHVGGDVEANQIDMATIVRICDWIICELIRIYHKLSLEEAQAIVDALSQRELPFIWHIAGKKRVLKLGLSYKLQTLLLLYTEPDTGVLVEDLCEWVEHSRIREFRSDVLAKLHGERLIEYDKANEIVYLSPLGIEEVETNIIKA
jgi:hypothetical protein